MPTYSLPPDYKLPAGVNIQIWNVYRVRRNFYETFDIDDARRALILESYPNTGGGTTVLDRQLIWLALNMKLIPEQTLYSVRTICLSSVWLILFLQKQRRLTS